MRFTVSFHFILGLALSALYVRNMAGSLPRLAFGKLDAPNDLSLYMSTFQKWHTMASVHVAFKLGGANTPKS